MGRCVEYIEGNGPNDPDLGKIGYVERVFHTPCENGPSVIVWWVGERPKYNHCGDTTINGYHIKALRVLGEVPDGAKKLKRGDVVDVV